MFLSGNTIDTHKKLTLSKQTQIVNYYDINNSKEYIFRNSWLPNYQFRFVENRVFLSTSAGSWCIIDLDEFYKLSSIAIDRTLYENLLNCFVILTENNTSTYFKAYQNWTAPHYRHPVHFIIVSTIRCNFSCLYCHVDVVKANSDKVKYDLNFEVGKRMVDFAFKSKQTTISFEFQGGESLLNFEVLKRLVMYIKASAHKKRKEIYLSVQTNLSTINDEQYAFLQQHEVGIGTSIDGNEEIHNAQRLNNNQKGTYQRVKNNSLKYDVPYLPTVTKISIPSWKEIIDLQLNSGYKTVTFQKVYPINSAKRNWSYIGVEFDDFLNYYNEVTEYLISKWSKDYYPLERRFLLALKKLFRGKDVDFADFGNPCGMVHSQLLFDYTGDIFTCDEGRDFEEFKIGNVSTSSYDEIVAGEKVRQLKSLSLSNDSECQTCAYRPYCSACPVYTRAVSGKMVAQFAGSDGCKFTKYIFDKISTLLITKDEVMENLIKHYDLR